MPLRFSWLLAGRAPLLTVLAFTCAVRAQPPVPATPATEPPHPPSIALWEHGMPGGGPHDDSPEQVAWRQEPDIVFPVTFNIHRPSVTPFLPGPNPATGCAVIIAPGGGHMFLTMDREGYDVGRLLARRGIAAFVLKYRLAHDRGAAEGKSPYSVDDAGADALRAVRLVRARAAEWHVDPHHIGLLGFSAGGEVALLAAMRHDAGRPDASDPVERVSSRPDFFAPIYPGGLQRADLAWSRERTPPAFLACAGDDRMPEQLAHLYVALRQAGVNAELHIYNQGGHGFGVRPRPLAVTGWPDRFVDWLGDRGFLR